MAASLKGHLAMSVGISLVQLALLVLLGAKDPEFEKRVRFYLDMASFQWKTHVDEQEVKSIVQRNGSGVAEGQFGIASEQQGNKKSKALWAATKKGGCAGHSRPEENH